MTSRISNQGSITVAGKTYLVLRHAIHEQLSEVSSLVCSLERDESDPPEPASLIDQPAVFTLKNNDGTEKRYFVGSVVRARQPEELVEVLVQPKAWRMTRRADCRIFQQMSAVDVVKKVLDQAGVDKTSWKTTGTYATRDYIVQYRETDLAFVARLLSEEGIYFSIQHDDQADTMVFGDDPKGFGPIDGTSTLVYRPSFGEGVAGMPAFVTDVARTQQVRSDKVTLRDYNPDKPKLKLESTATTDKAEAEVYVWPGRFTDPKVGTQLAQVLLDSLRADRDIVTGRAGVLSFVPGMQFTIEGHPYAPLNQEYLIVGVDQDGRNERGDGEKRGTEGSEHSGGCRFRAIPAGTVPYRPPRQVREHFVSGAQTAITTGPSAQEIYTDAGGHVKVQFHWDRLGTYDEKSSVWMRTSQLPTGGSMLLPRMKWEVTVRYLEGDVDRPFVMARMTNPVTPPPYTLPDHKTKSSIQTATTPGGGSTNETRMCDTAGSEEMMMNASKDMSVDVNNNTTESIGNNLTRQIGSNHNLSITNSLTASVGASQTVNVSGNQDVHVSTFMVDQVTGNHTLGIGGSRSIKIGGDHKREVGGDSTLSTGGMMIDLVVGEADEHGLANYTHTVGAALVEMTAGGRSITVGGNRSETATLAKIIYTAASRSVDVTGTMSQKVAGLVYRKTDGDLAETAGGNFMEVATGAQILKCTNLMIEGQSLVSIVMGASTITLTPHLVAIAGASVKVDGQVIDDGALVVNN